MGRVASGELIKVYRFLANTSFVEPTCDLKARRSKKPIRETMLSACCFYCCCAQRLSVHTASATYHSRAQPGQLDRACCYGLIYVHRAQQVMDNNKSNQTRTECMNNAKVLSKVATAVTATQYKECGQ